MKRYHFTRRITTAACLLLLAFATACKPEPGPEKPSGVLTLTFEHLADSLPLRFNTMAYTNVSGNPYEVTEVMYFISDIRLYHSDGRIIRVSDWENIHYIDSNIPSTLTFSAGSGLPYGRYDSLTFTFGLSEEINTSYAFVNPPEVNMAWPEVLGGGYHYLMLNGWWRDTVGIRKPYNFHLGIGQIYENNSGQVADITGFIHNHFDVTPSGSSFTVPSEGNVSLIVSMHIQSWFDTPLNFDFNVWGGAIMQNQDAMYIGAVNGRDAFSIRQE